MTALPSGCPQLMGGELGGSRGGGWEVGLGHTASESEEVNGGGPVSWGLWALGQGDEDEREEGEGVGTGPRVGWRLALCRA